MEGNAGTGQLNGADQAEPIDREADIPAAEPIAEASEGPSQGLSRLSRRGVAGVCAVLVLLAAAVATGGYFALRSHRESQALARDDAAAVAAAKDCVAATQAPDLAALPAAQQKITECSTGNFSAQSAVYSSMLVEGYQAADVHIQLTDMHTAVERNNGDGSVDVLMALRVKVDNTAAQAQEFGYRLRVNMAREDGQFKVARLDQVGG
jgi:Mce-associated membrane protein